MKKQHYIILLIICFFSKLSFSDSSKIDDKPLMFEKEMIEAGEFFEGQKINAEFTFENSGNQPIKITKISSSCSCSIGDYPKQIIDPNEKGIITVESDTKGKIGEIRNQFLVAYEGGGQNYSQKLNLLATVSNNGMISSMPSSISLTNVRVGTIIDKIVTLERIGGVEYSTDIVDINTPTWVEVKSLDKEIEQSKWILEVNIEVPSKRGTIIDSITVHTDSSIFPITNIPVVMRIEGDLVAIPNNIVKRIESNKETSDIVVSIEDHKQRKFKIIKTRFKNDDDLLMTKINQEKNEIIINFKDYTRLNPGVFKDELIIDVETENLLYSIPVNMLLLISDYNEILKK